MLIRLLVVVVAIVLGVLGAPSSASACSGPVCADAMFFPARGSVPANLPAVMFWPATQSADLDGGAGPEVRFVRLDSAGPSEVAFTLEPADVAGANSWFWTHVGQATIFGGLAALAFKRLAGVAQRR